MLFAKFVTEELTSPGGYGNIDYSNFGEPIEVDAAPASKGQCASGIHVIPLTENIDFENVIFASTIIILEADESDIVFREGNGKVRLRKATPLREANDREKDIILKAACKSAFYAYSYARFVDQSPLDQTREAACKEAEFAYRYASDVDKSPCDLTRKAVGDDSYWAYKYSSVVEPLAETSI